MVFWVYGETTSCKEICLKFYKHCCSWIGEGLKVSYNPGGVILMPGGVYCASAVTYNTLKVSLS